MRIPCFFLRKLKSRCLLFSLSLLILCLIKTFVVDKKDSVSKNILTEVGGRPEGSSGKQLSKHDIDCSAIFDLDPVEVGRSLEIRRKNIDLADNDIIMLTSDCEKYKVVRGYEEIPVSDEERRFPLAYTLIVHKDAYMVEKILRAIYMPHNVYCFHYDQKSSKNFTTVVQNLAKCFPNVFVASKLESVQYAHVTRLKADLNCLSDLLASAVSWKYIINLCGQDFPLKSNFELVSELKKLNGRNMLESSRPTHMKKSRFTFIHELKDVPYEYKKLPVKTAQAKDPPPHGIEIFVGSAYFVLSRQFVSHIFSSQLAQDFLSWSADTYSPDEHFWASLVRVPGVPGEIPRSEPDVTDLMSKTRLVKWHYLEGKLYPACTGTHIRSVCIYGAAELRWLLTYGHWFANKLDHKVDPVLIKCLEEKLVKAQRHWVNMSTKGTSWSKN